MSNADRIPYRHGCVFIVQPYRSGWHIEIEIDGELKGSYTHSEEPGGESRAQAIREATRVADGILASRANP
jgi:hypothetical protein